MPAGLQVWDASGNLIIDTSTLLGRILGSVEIVAGTSGQITDPSLATGTGFAIPQNVYEAHYDRDEPGPRFPSVSFSGTTMSWVSYSSSQWLPITYVMYYGVY